MRRNQRWSHNYSKHKTIRQQKEDNEYKEKLNEDLKSLECSSVQQVQPTNQSHEMSWLQKLVYNMDDDNKLNNINIGLANRNFSRKNSVTHSNLHDQEPRLQSNNKLQSRYSMSKNQSKYDVYTPVDRSSQKGSHSKQDYTITVNGFKNNQPQRMPKNYNTSSSAQKYTSSYYDRNGYAKHNNYTSNNQENYADKFRGYKQVDLNDSNQSYGRIKKVNKSKEQVEDGKKRSCLPQNKYSDNFRSYQSTDKYQRNRHLQTQVDKKSSIYSSNSNYLRQSRNSVNKVANSNTNTYSKYEFSKAQAPKKRADYLTNSPSYEKNVRKYKTIDQQKELVSYGSKQKQFKKSLYNQKSKQLQKATKPNEKQEDFRMDEMAKKLNMVLQNINQKSKLISNQNSEQKPALSQKVNQTPIRQLTQSNSHTKPNQSSQSKNLYSTQNYKANDARQGNLSSYKFQTQDQGRYTPKENRQFIERSDREKQRDKYREPSRYNIKQKIIQSQPNREHLRQKLRSTLRQPSKQSYSYSYKQKQREKDNLLLAPPTYLNERPQSSQFLSTVDHLLPQPCKKNQTKFQLMKKSLSMYKHIPHQIILEQSSSEINSEHSPRTQMLNRQFKGLFETLDRKQSGELSKGNCAVEGINDEIKYLFGGLFSRIKYKGQVITLKAFIEECQNVVRDFKIEELREIFTKNKITDLFKLSDKETESERWNNDTNNQYDSKRSSQRSEVVKKYEFVQQKQIESQVAKIVKINESDQKNKPKINWSTAENKKFLQNPLKFQQNDITKQKILNKRQQNKDSKLKQRGRSASLSNTQENSQTTHQKQRNLGNNKSSQGGNILVEKQNIKIPSYQGQNKYQGQKQKRDFEKMCQNLNNKLNNYLTTIKHKEISAPQIPLQFSELSKHWSTSK